MQLQLDATCSLAVNVGATTKPGTRILKEFPRATQLEINNSKSTGSQLAAPISPDSADPSQVVKKALANSEFHCLLRVGCRICRRSTHASRSNASCLLCQHELTLRLHSLASQPFLHFFKLPGLGFFSLVPAGRHVPPFLYTSCV